jgi:hypothetical protein
VKLYDDLKVRNALVNSVFSFTERLHFSIFFLCGVLLKYVLEISHFATVTCVVIFPLF